jgi:hypothetical protein
MPISTKNKYILNKQTLKHTDNISQIDAVIAYPIKTPKGTPI